MIKPKLYKGQPLKGEWLITKKLDGVRMLRAEDGMPISRSGKPLYNLSNIPHEITDAEVFKNNWGDSVSMVRTFGGALVDVEDVYQLDPPDERLIINEVTDPSPEMIAYYLAAAISFGHEGLVLRQGDRWFKVKPVETYDVVVTGVQMGTGKYEGMMGALITDMGKVGTGFTDSMRVSMIDMVGKTIEVECMQLTDDGKFRHPRFVRERFDK